MVKYLRENFFVRWQRFDSQAHLNQLMLLWLAEVADERPLRRFEQTPSQRFMEEQPHLMSLPAGEFDTSYHDIRQAAWDGYIEVRGNRYSVPEAWCGRPVTIRITLDDELRIYGDDALIATHRLNGERVWQTVPEHHQPLWQRTCLVEQRPLADYEEMVR